MLIDTLTDLGLILLSIAVLYLSLLSYARRRRPHWHRSLQQRRATVLLVLTLAVVAIRVSKAVLGGHTSELDIALLEFIHQHASPATVSGFGWITLTGSSRFLTPLGALLTAALLLARQYREALLLPLSMISAALLVYILKLAVARERPALWATDWYWGYSFPSGHTMGTAACATALALCAAQLWPARRRYALSLASLWIGLVATSRLVLGVHWPTDVLVAACLGIVLPILIRLTAGSIWPVAPARTQAP
ncbi:phosphatase PAP2 family protein [Halopseudomonas sp.]|uniref:phosphatase PAP2 family protein n=1 Tax=Halopseudomonas sp. TaxID=2901191 RepID=UPI0030039003